MDALLKAVAEKTGLPVEKAKAAVDAVFEFLRDKLPEPIVGQIQKVMEGGGGTLGGVTDKLGDMAGGLTDKLGDMAGGLTDKLGGMFGKKD